MMSAGIPRAALYRMSWGFSRMEDIMKAASQSSFMPLLEKEAAMGIVPYMHRGEAIPRALAAKIPAIPSFLSCRERKRLWIWSFANTDTADPISIPRTQYPAICSSCTLK